MKPIQSYLKFSLLICLVVSLYSCSRITGTGPVVTESRTLGEITELDLEMNATVYLIKGDSQSVVLKAQQNILNVVSTELKNNCLKVKTLESITDTEPIQIWITVKSIESIELNGAGKILSTTNFSAEKISVELSGSGKISLEISCEVLNAEVSGSGDLDLSGQISESDMELSGSGNINSLNCSIDNCTIDVSGSGSAKLAIGSSLNASVNGSGVIEYRGNPQKVKSEINGSGKILKIE
jgi:hypothetical protein